MRVIPVLDVQGGIAVHAVRGERHRYRPLESVLVATSEPLAVIQAFRARLGLEEIYVADLDAISRTRPPTPLISRLAGEARLLLDAGVSDVDGAHRVLESGVHKVIIGSETVADQAVLASLPSAVPVERMIFSLDLRSGAVLSGDALLARAQPLEVLAMLDQLGWQEVIVLDLARVGTGAGVDQALVAEASRRFPRLRILAGGGVRRVEDLHALRAVGAAGALVATAFHQGAITADDLRALS